MTRIIEEPITKSTNQPHREDETVTSHPAFAQISASRSTGGHSTLYGSDFDHHARITIRISASELCRNLNNDWHFERGQYVEVDLSEAQWATFVSSPNVGSGVPCTLTWLRGEGMIPGLPRPQTRSQQFGDEMRGAIGKAMEELKEAAAAVDATSLPRKKKDELKAQILAGARRLADHAPFIADQFDEHMEGTVEKAKNEIHGYMTGQIMRAGLSALGGNPDAVVPLALPTADRATAEKALEWGREG